MKAIKRPVAILLLLMSLFFVVGVQPVYADDSPTLKEAITEAKGLEENKNKSSSQIKREVASEYYNIDMEDSSWLSGAGANILNTMANMFFAINKAFAGFIASITETALDFDLFDQISSAFTKIFSGLKRIFNINGAAGGLMLLGITCTLLLAVIMFAKGSAAGAVGHVCKLVLILVLSGLLFVMPMQLLKMGANVTQDIGGALMESAGSSTSESIGSSKSSIGAKGADRVWSVMVDLPWQSLEFNKTPAPNSALDKINGNNMAGKLLNVHPEKRESDIDKLVSDENINRLKAESSIQGTRFGEVFLVGIINIVIGLAVLAMALLLIATQFLVVIFAFLGVFVLLLALFPGYGLERVQTWASYLLMGFVLQIVVYFGFCLTFLVLQVVYGNMISKMGVLMSGFIVIALLVAIFLFRHQIMSIIGVNNSQGVGSQLKQPAQKLMSQTTRMGRRGTEKYNERRRDNKDLKRNNPEAYKEKKDKSLLRRAERVAVGRKGQEDFDQAKEKAKEYMKDKRQAMREKGEEMTGGRGAYGLAKHGQEAFNKEKAASNMRDNINNVRGESMNGENARQTRGMKKTAQPGVNKAQQTAQKAENIRNAQQQETMHNAQQKAEMRKTAERSWRDKTTPEKRAEVRRESVVRNEKADRVSERNLRETAKKVDRAVKETRKAGRSSEAAKTAAERVAKK